MRVSTLLIAAALAMPATASAANGCPAPAVAPLQSTTVAPIANELAAPSGHLGFAGGVLSQAYDASLTLDQVLLRMQVESCRNMASITPAPGVVDPADPAAYKPRTEFDNTPWRFNMSQNGKNMTADEFSAWMKSRGVRVARGAAPAAPAAVPATDAPGTVPAPAATPGMPPGTLPESAPAPAGTPPGTTPQPTEPATPVIPQ
jgi:hypothetical protein